jgi:hypothetical protein
MRILSDIKKFDDAWGQFRVRVTCKCGTRREFNPEALARIVGWSTTLEALVPRMRCSTSRSQGGPRKSSL